MYFNSLHFLIFFPLVIILYFALSYRYRWMFLLAASYYFYMSWKPEYIILILASTLIDYYTGLQMGKTQIKSERTRYLVLSLLSNLGILFGFKYFNFFNDSARALFDQFNIFYNVPAFDVLLPVGISFYTFQTLSYTIDVYRGKKEPETHLGIFALYVAFFPQLVAGPIERSIHLLPQFHQNHDFDYQRVTDGMKLMIWGFFKKLVIADRLAVLVDAVYNDPTQHTGLPLIVATYFFAFQIFCDFSGYSDIAIGAAQILGYDLMENFRRPYHSKSIGEFWQRWHISLSTWFRDYLYIPLGGNRVAKWRWQYNLMVVFLVSGLWHGANWTFVIWGGLHGFYMLVSMWTEQPRARLRQITRIEKLPWLHNALQMFVTFHLVVFAWIFFRANSISDAYYILTHLFVNLMNSMNSMLILLNRTPGGKIGFVLTILMPLFVMECIHIIQRRTKIRQLIDRKPLLARWIIYIVAASGFLMFAKLDDTDNAFIYFRF